MLFPKDVHLSPNFCLKRFAQPHRNARAEQETKMMPSLYVLHSERQLDTDGTVTILLGQLQIVQLVVGIFINAHITTIFIS